MAELKLRTVEGRALTNQEVDANFTNLNADIIALNSDIVEINDVRIPNEVDALEILIAQKQDSNAKLTSLSDVSSNGLLSISGNTITPRSLASDSILLTITNGNGVSGNPTFALSANILTNSSTHTLSNKSISGNNNTITNISLTSSVSGILSVEHGGTDASTAADARANLSVLRNPGGIGLVVKTGTDSSVTRSLIAGDGIVLTNTNGVSNNPTVAVDPDLINRINNIQDGATGAVGPRGATGFQGASGARGEVGPQGPQGATGITGASGVNGSTGPAGINGSTGPQGASGAAGAAAAAGATGAVGASGIAGATGPAGTAGATGPRGLLGPQGLTGATGPLPAGILVSAYLVFEGQGVNGTCVILKRSANVLSVTRTAKGRYTVAFAPGTFADENYCVTGTCSTFNASGNMSGTLNYDHVVNVATTTTTTLELNTGDMRADGNNVGHDVDRVHVMIVA